MNLLNKKIKKIRIHLDMEYNLRSKRGYIKGGGGSCGGVIFYPLCQKYKVTNG